MASSAEKLLQRLRQTKANWSPREFRNLLTGYGFDRVRETNHGTLYEHPDYAEWATVIVPRHNELKKWVGREVLKIVERVIEAETD